MTEDQGTWPEHLRDDAPTQTCSGCGRHTWSKATFGRSCGMTQPDGTTCPGSFRDAPPPATMPADGSCPHGDDPSHAGLGKGWCDAGQEGALRNAARAAQSDGAGVHLTTPEET